jgi:MFS family permease
LIQGVALVTFPAASAVFTNPSDYGLSSTEYGAMFVPQAVMAIVSSLLGAGLRKRLGTKRIYLLGLFSNLLAMTLLVVSRFVMKEHSLAYGILLVATTCMGIGFGFTVPALNTFAAAFFPKKVDRAVLVLNALLGLGTALAPVFVALFCRTRNLVGPAGAGWRFDSWTAVVQPRSDFEGRAKTHTQRILTKAKINSPRGFGFSPLLRCSTACAKP